MNDLKSLFQRLFGKKAVSGEPDAPVAVEEAAAPLADVQAGVEEDAPPEPAMEEEAAESLLEEAETTTSGTVYCGGSFCGGWLTNVGQVRNHNEDALLVFTGEQVSDDALPPFGLFVLADGMGGHHAGEVASALAVQTASAYLLSHVYQPVLARSEQHGESPSLAEVMHDAIAYANQKVTDNVPGSGSTLTCGMLLGSRMFMGHVGDSRAYLLRDGDPARQLTNDHSLVNRLVEMGQLTLEEAAVHPQRNVLYRAIGQGDNLDIDVFTIPLQYGDRLLLCSDGLWGMVEEEEMWRIIFESPTIQEACVQLVDAANAAGGNDNITVILVEILYGQV